MPMKDWSTTASENDTAGTINWAEGQLPSTVNNSARQLMADVRAWYDDYEWRDLGHTPTFTTTTTFTVTGDQTSKYLVNCPIRCTDATTLYGVITAVAFTTVTTVTVSLVSGSLSSSLTAVSVGLSPTNAAIPFQAISFRDADAGAAAGPILDLHRDSASPAASDIIPAVRFSGEDGAGNKQTYAQIHGVITDPTSTSEDGQLVIQTVVAGTVADRVTVGQGLQVGAPTGGDKGVGTANFDNDVYKDNVNITTPAAVTNFVNGHVVYCFGDTPNEGTAFDCVANIAAAWESVGPTGSGATNIWTALDAVPATAKAVILSIENTVTGSVTATNYTQYLYARKTGSSAANGASTAVSYAGFTNRSGSSESDLNLTTQIVPIDTSRRFDLYRATAGGGASYVHGIYLVGWIDSLI